MAEDDEREAARRAWQVEVMRDISRSLSSSVDELISLSSSITEDAVVRGDDGPGRDALQNAFEWLESYELLAEYQLGMLKDLARMVEPTERI